MKPTFSPNEFAKKAKRFLSLFWSKTLKTSIGFIASLGEGGVTRRSRVTEGVGAESGRGMRLAVFVTAVTPSDSPSASHLPQEEGLGLRRFASG
jgi:hypothetical protein